MSAPAAAVWCCTSCGAVYHKDFPRCPNDGAEVRFAERDPLLDQRFGQYVIDRLIGEGGMGRVYAAHHATLSSKRYAIKVLLGDVAATSSMRRRFAKEAESASQLDHPNIVHVLDYGEMPSGLPYIVMDYVDGVPLTSLAEGWPMDPARVIQIARGVCDGLGYAHDHGVVHRDLKPDNILVVIGSDGREVPRIADFGLATTAEPAGVPRLTTTGIAMGTPAYAAPEQMAGKRVDARADLYSLGMTMFEMLTGGQLPFEGNPLELMTAKAHRDAPRLTEIVPTLALPAGLEDLVAQLIRRKPVERPTSIRAVLSAFDRIAAVSGAGHIHEATPFDDLPNDDPVDSERTRQRSKRRPGGHRVENTFEVRRRGRIWPWLLFAGCAVGGTIGWVHHRYGISSALQTVDALAKHIMGDEQGEIRNETALGVVDLTPHSLFGSAAHPGEAGVIDPPQPERAAVPDETVESAADPSSAEVPSDGAVVEPEAGVPTPVASATKKERRRTVRRPGEQVRNIARPSQVGVSVSKRSEITLREPAGQPDPPPPQPSFTTPSAAVSQAPGEVRRPVAAVAPPPGPPLPSSTKLPAPAAPAAALPAMTAEIADLAVSGALSRSLVRKAVERVMPAIQQCLPSAPKTERTRFTIDESRRAQNVRGTSGCIVAALGSVRIETTPDVGDAEIDLQIRFVAKP